MKTQFYLLTLCVFVLCSVGCSPKNNDTAAARELLQTPEEPLGFLKVLPEPAKVVSLSSPDNWGYLVGTADGDIRWPETICAGVSVKPLLRPGDEFNSFDNIRLSLDGNIVKVEPSHSVILVAIAG